MHLFSVAGASIYVDRPAASPSPCYSIRSSYVPSMLQKLVVICVCRNQRQCGRRNPISLETVAASLAQSLPQQQEQLALLKRVSAYTSAQLMAQTVRPSTYCGELALTPQQRSIRGMAYVGFCCVEAGWGVV